MKDIICDNGIRLRIVESNKFTRNMLSVNFIVPLNIKSASENCLLSSVMSRGCIRLPEINDVSDFLDTHYGATFTLGTGKKGENQIVRFSVSYIDKKYTDKSFDIENDMLSFLRDMIADNTVFDEKIASSRTETEKKNLIDSINANINDKTFYANLRCSEIMFANEKYGIDSSGSIKEIDALEYKDLIPAYKRLIKQSKIVVFALGRFNDENIIYRINHLFDNVFDCPIGQGSVFPAERILNPGKVKEICEESDMTQSKLVLGFRTKAVDYMDNVGGYVLFNAIFSTMPYSRLFTNVREKKSLCYYCSSIFDRHKGIMLVYAGISADKKELVKKEILKQISDISKKISGSELREAKEMLIDGIIQARDNPTSIESHYINSIVSGVEIPTDEYMKIILNTTAEDVYNAAKSMSLDTIYFLKGNRQNDDDPCDESNYE